MRPLHRKLPSANALFVFEAAARHESFTRAAVELGVTQPAVSRMLARLEAHLGVALFERLPGGIRLSEAGRLLHARVADGFAGIDVALETLAAWRGGGEPVTLSVSTAFTTHWLMPRMDRLQQAFPDVDLRFQLIPGPVGGPVDDVDLGMRFLEAGAVPAGAAPLVAEILLPVCSPAYAERLAGGEAAVFMDLAGSDLGWHRSVAGPPRRGGELAFADYAIVVQAALLGQGVAQGWINVVSHWLREGALVPAADTAVVTARRCHLLPSLRRPLREPVRRIRDWIADEMAADLAALDSRHPALGLARLAV